MTARRRGRIRSLEVQLRALAAILDREPRCLVLLDCRGRVVFRTNTAERLLCSLDARVSLRGRRLLAHDPAVDLEAVLSRALHGGCPEVASLGVDANGTRWLAHVSSVEDAAPPTASGGVLIAVELVSSCPEARRPRSPIFRALWSLTPSECEVAEDLALGLSIDEIAAHRRTSRETARFHVKQLLAKTGTRRQSQLVAVLVRVAR